MATGPPLHVAVCRGATGDGKGGPKADSDEDDDDDDPRAGASGAAAGGRDKDRAGAKPKRHFTEAPAGAAGGGGGGRWGGPDVRKEMLSDESDESDGEEVGGWAAGPRSATPLCTMAKTVV